MSESGLYPLILRSNEPDAELFQRWVTNEVLPSIRRTGQYATAPEEAAQRVRRLRLENDELEMRNLAT
eukprot:5286163-Alexandrium_andersonii.AAC.1